MNITDRERNTILAALRVWQTINTPSGRRFYSNGDFDWQMLDDIATNGGDSDALDQNEIDILIDDKINPAEIPADAVCGWCGGDNNVVHLPRVKV